MDNKKTEDIDTMEFAQPKGQTNEETQNQIYKYINNMVTNEVHDKLEEYFRAKESIQEIVDNTDSSEEFEKNLPCCDLLNLNEYNIYSRLKQTMDTLKITQTSLAEMTGISRGTIITILKNPESTSLKNAYKIAKVLGKPIYYLFVFAKGD